MPHLDGLRCFAALAVVGQHTFLSPWLPLGASGLGSHGVWVFFVLSGFLITGILLQTREAAATRPGAVMGAFYARRFLRIFPLYYAVLLAGAALSASSSLRQDFWWHLSYLSNWMMAVRANWADWSGVSLWSLGVEEQFYLLWPALVLFTPRRWLPRVLVATLLGGIASRALLTALLAKPGVVPTGILLPLTSNLDPLALGALLAWHRWHAPLDVARRRRWTRRALAAGGVLVAGVVAFSITGIGYRAILVVETLGTSLVSVWLVDRAATGFRAGSAAARVLGARAVRYLGSISYGIYLLHGPVLWTLLDKSGFERLGLGRLGFARPGGTDLLADVTFALLVTAITVAIASLSWYAFERPLNALKGRFPYPTGAAAPELPRAAAAAAS